jgi:hypothetical protein
VRRFAIAGVLVLGLLLAGCSSSKKAAPATGTSVSVSTVTGPAATFTAVPSTPLAAGATPRPRPAHPVVAASCLQSLHSYRFAGTLALQIATPSGTATPAASDFAGSLANLLSNVSFKGSALAPDRTEATISFGGSGTQPLQIVRIGSKTWSRFGTGAWQQGNQIAGFGNILQFDPATLCQQSLTRLEGSGQTPARETVNGIPSLRYQFSGAQLAGTACGEGGGDRGTPTPIANSGATPTPPAANFNLTLWVAQKGNYPVRVQVQGNPEGGAFSFALNVSDVNGKDIQISAPQ